MAELMGEEEMLRVKQLDPLLFDQLRASHSQGCSTYQSFRVISVSVTGMHFWSLNIMSAIL